MNKSYFLIPLFIIVSLLPAGVIQAGPRPLIGAQISVLTPETLDGCETYFRNLKKMGYNTIILRVFHNRGDRFHGLVKETARKPDAEGVYFGNSKVPIVADILTPICRCAHRTGLKIFAWMNTLKADYSHQLKQKVLTYNQKNGRIDQEKTLLDPTAPENINFLTELFSDLAAYPIDGILLQDDLMLRHNQGFRVVNHKISPTPEKLYNFSSNPNTKIESYKPAFKIWRQQQASALQALANRIFSACRQIKPSLKCAHNVHYEILYQPRWGRDWFAWTRTALENSTADYLMIMAYQERIRKELGLNSDEKLANAMDIIFTNALKWQTQKTRIIFKFEAPPASRSAEQKRKLLTTLHQTITNAQRKHWLNLILTPCNSLTAAESRMK